jgi:hypothetical protein
VSYDDKRVKQNNLAVEAGAQRSVERVQFLRGTGFYFERIFSHAGHCASGAGSGIPRSNALLPASRLEHKAVPEVLPNGTVFPEVDQNGSFGPSHR